MPIRLVTPTSVKKWPFVLGDAVLLTLAFTILSLAEKPFGAVPILLAAAAVFSGIAVMLAPFLLEYEARLRIAEAGARDNSDASLKKITLLSEQLNHAVSRSQSTEEEVGKALAATEEIVEKLNEQSEELSQFLHRNDDREKNDLRQELDTARDMIGIRLTGLETSVSDLSGQLGAWRESETGAETGSIDRTLLSLREDIAGLGDTVTAIRAALASLQQVTAKLAERPAPPENATPPRREEPGHPPTAPAAPPAALAPQTTAAVDESPAIEHPKPAAPPPPKTAKSTPTPKPAATEAPKSASVGILELGLEGIHSDERAPARKSKKDQARMTAVTATAYIGIGNKLYLRGDGPGLTWQKGVPMQFLAIGKWGWSTTEADRAFACQIYKNDEDASLDGRITVEPLEKKDINPRF